MSTALEIVAIGARTPVGLTAETSAAAVRAGISRLCELPFAGRSGEPVVGVADRTLSPALEGRSRLLAMIESVLQQLERKLWLGGARDVRTHLALSLPEERPGFTDRDAAWLVEVTRERCRAAGVDARVELLGRGHAGGIQAIELASEEATRHPETLFLVLGADSYHHPDTFLWLEHARRFAGSGARGGFFPGEGAGWLALGSPDLRTRLGLPRLAFLRGTRTARERLLRESDTGSFGEGMTEAVLGATRELTLPRDAIDAVYSDINGERYRSEEWGFVAMRAGKVFRSFQYVSPADCWGDVGSASVTLAGVLAVQSFARAYARGPRALVIAGSDSGLRGAMLIQDPRVP